MTFGNLGKRVLDTAKKWGRRPPLPLDSAPSPDEAIGSRSVVLVPAPPPVDHAAADRRRFADAMRAARRERSGDAIRTFIASVRHLPLFSGTATQLVRKAGEENVSGRELARLIATDAALVAHLLRIVNSPYFGFPRRLATVGDALAVLGVDHVRRMVTAAVLQRPLLAYLHDSATVRAFWRHELLCAALSRHIAAHRGGDGELAYMAGLMHDVGRLAMLMQYPQQGDALLHVQGGDDSGSLDREFAAFGFDHAQAGGALLESWGLPKEIVLAAHTHGDGLSPADPVAASVWLANGLTHAIDEVDDDDEEPAPWMVEIGLSAAARRRILDEIRAFGDEGA